MERERRSLRLYLCCLGWGLGSGAVTGALIGVVIGVFALTDGYAFGLVLAAAGFGLLVGALFALVP